MYVWFPPSSPCFCVVLSRFSLSLCGFSPGSASVRVGICVCSLHIFCVSAWFSPGSPYVYVGSYQVLPVSGSLKVLSESTWVPPGSLTSSHSPKTCKWIVGPKLLCKWVQVWMVDCVSMWCCNKLVLGVATLKQLGSSNLASSSAGEAVIEMMSINANMFDPIGMQSCHPDMIFLKKIVFAFQ